MSERSLADWLAYLEQLHPTAIDMGLERVRSVAARLGLGRPAPRVVTVTGTNGKGSTCAFLAALLGAEGRKVGIYSSPHLQRYNERVWIDGDLASDGALCEAFAAVERARGDVSLTYFEMGTLAAFWLFERAALDVAVLEVGLGGRLDAVNVVDADVAVLTSIGLDHAEWLGNTRESVATEKAGIFRAGRPAVCGDLDPPEVLEQIARSLNVEPWLCRGRDFQLQAGTDHWDWQGVDRHGQPVHLRNLPLLELPIENAAVALQAFYLLEAAPDEEAVIRGLRSARLTGRFDRRRALYEGRSVQLLLDVGHNPHAAEYLARRLERLPHSGRRLAVFGLLADKDLQGVVAALRPQFDSWAVCTLDSSRARPATELAAVLEQQGAAVCAYDSVVQALEASCAQAGAEDLVVVFGSFYCVAECLDWLERHAGEKVDGLAG